MLYRVKYFALEPQEAFKLHIQAHNFMHCAAFMIDYLDDKLGENLWEILEIKTLLNFIDAEQSENHFKYTPEEIECPVCALEHTVLDKIMAFKCPQCRGAIRVADNGWLTIQCPKCGVTLLRECMERDPQTGEWLYIEGGDSDPGEDE